MSKESTKKALDNYFQRQTKIASGPTRKNTKPEKLVEQQVLQHLRASGYFVEVVESKAVFSKSAGRFLRGQARAGFVDVVGCSPQGQFVALELKSKGRLASLRPEQREFLVQVISRGGFGACVDSVDRLDQILSAYKANPSKETLLSFLPTKREEKLTDLFVTEDP